MHEATFGGVPTWLLIAYLEELGGQRRGERVVEGAGWSAALIEEERPTGTLAVRRVTVRLAGPGAALVLEALRKKALRGGG